MRSYDVIIIGGGMIGSACAWFLADNPDFDGTVAVIERDPSLEFSSTSRTAGAIRQQFSTEINIRISQFGVEHIRAFREQTGGDEDAPEIHIDEFGYLLLTTEAGAPALREAVALQNVCGVGTRLLDPDDIARDFPAIDPSGVHLASHNPRDEGTFGGQLMHPWWRRQAKRRGTDFITAEVAGIEVRNGHVARVRLASGETLGAGAVVNAAGPRAAGVAAMAGLALPVEPRKRFSWQFAAAKPPAGPLPLIHDLSGVYVKPESGGFHTGCAPDEDVAVDPDDFTMDPHIFEEKVWPAIAARVPAFEAIKPHAEWAGHYAFNTFDQNAIIGRHPDLTNFIFVNGFSGHGLQQAPAMGRGVSELIAHNGYRTLDLQPLSYDRLASGAPFLEKAVI